MPKPKPTQPKVCLTIRVKQEQREAWHKQAESEGINLTSWVITNLNRTASEKKEGK